MFERNYKVLFYAIDSSRKSVDWCGSIRYYIMTIIFRFDQEDILIVTTNYLVRRLYYPFKFLDYSIRISVGYGSETKKLVQF